MPMLTTTMTKTTPMAATLTNFEATQTAASSANNTNDEFLLHQQQQQQQQQQYNNHNYYQHIAPSSSSSSSLLVAHQHPVTANATTAASATIATGSATFNGNNANLNSNLANGNNNNNNNNNTSHISNSHGSSSHTVDNSNGSGCNSGGGGSGDSTGSISASNGICVASNIGVAVLPTSASTTGGSIVGISTMSALKKPTSEIATTTLAQQQQQQQQHASREDVASLGGASSINSQISSATNVVASVGVAANNNNNNAGSIGNTNNNNNNNNNSIGLSNGLHPIANHNGNGFNTATRQPSSILKGSKENLLHYYNGDATGVGGGGCGGGSSIGSENGIIGIPNGQQLDPSDPDDGLGPLPPKWETAYTERGELYFIDHNTGTSHWLDPRLSKFQKKSLEDCCEDELPYGWEKIQDSLYGTYYIDHVNRRTQYENPVLEAKRRAAEQSKSQPHAQLQQHQLPPPQQRSKTPTLMQGLAVGLNGGISTNSLDISQRAMQPPPAPLINNEPGKALLPYKFTRNPAELQGKRITTTLMKSARGLGITIVGGDNNSETVGVDEFLQIKSIVPNGPAWLDGQLQMGDVLVYVNDTCVLGFTHHDMVNIFQSILPGETATLEVCRGYPLPFDPNDPNTEVVTTIAVDGIANEPEKQRRILMDLNMDGNYNFLDDSTGTVKSGNGGSASQFILMKKPEMHTFSIVKGAMGFGFTIADSASGQKVKKILDRNCCTQLQEGDVLLEINDINVRNMSHVDVVQVLKECSKTTPTIVKIQRVPEERSVEPVGLTSNFGNVAKLRKNFVGGTAALSGGGLFRSKTPTADLYSTQQKEVLPMRPKTPLVDTRRARVKTPNNELNDVDALNQSNGDQIERTLAESKSQVDGKSNNSLQEIEEIPFMDPYPKLVSRLSERLAEATLLSETNVNGGSAMSGYGLPTGQTVSYGLNSSADYENQVYASVPSQHNAVGGGNSNNYNPIYGMTSMPPSMHPINHHHTSTAGAPHIYAMHNTPLSLMTTGNTPTVTTAMAGHPSHLHHESCYCYDCQDMRQQRHRFAQASQSSPHQLQGGYYTQQMPGTSAMPLNHSLGASHLSAPQQSHLQSQYSPLAATGASGTLQAAHLQNERMQKRVNELLNDRRRVGFSPLDTHTMGYHHAQQHSPAVSSVSQHAAVNWGLGGGGANGGGVGYHTLQPQQLSGGASVPIRNGINGLIDVSEDADQYELTEVTLERQALGFGFRIVGGTEEGSQVTVGHIVPGGAADNDHRIATGDEILSIDGINVVNSSHHKVVSLVGESSLRGQVSMILRRRVRGAGMPIQTQSQQPPAQTLLRRYPYDVIVSRSEHEGFGFVIISSSNQYYGSTIGKLIPGSPADRCGELKVGDRIIAVNRIDIAGMSHGDVVNLIKESGLHVRLTIGCPIKEGPSPGASNDSNVAVANISTMHTLNSSTSQASPSQQSQLTQPPAPSLLTHPLNGPSMSLGQQQQQQQQQQPAQQKSEMSAVYMERPSTSVAAAAASALSLHQQPQL